MKRQAATVKQTLLLLAMSSVFILLSSSLVNATNRTEVAGIDELNSGETQIGFYDLLAEKEEIYDFHIKETHPNNYAISMTMPKDNLFTLKGNIVLVDGNHERHTHLDFTPTYFYSPQPDQMINDFVDYTTHNDLLIRSINTNNTQLIVTRKGMLILMPEVFLTEKGQ